MNPLSATISASFCYYFRDFLARVQGLASDLTDEEFWENPFSYGNSMGHLALHIIGNLNYYIGTQLASTGYVRDREREFSEVNHPSKAETLHQLETAVALVVAILEKQSDDDWAHPYRAVGVDDVHDRFSIFLRCAVHFHHHIGQMGYVKDEYSRRKQGSQ